MFIHKHERFVQSRWFALADMLIVLGSGAIWYLRPEYGWRILLIALLPWGMRILAGKKPFKSTAFDLLILLFLVTAVIGMRTAYDPAASWSKFWLVLGAVLFFYALAAQPRENTWLIVEGFTLVGVLVALYYLFAYDWQASPVRVEIVNQIGRAWMKVRPFHLQTVIQDEDIVSNVLLVLVPFPIFLFFQRNRWRLIYGGISSVLFLAGLGMASTREAILFLVIGLVFAVWGWVSHWLESRGFELSRRIFWICSGTLLALALFLLIRYPDGVLGIAQGAPVFSRFENRITVIDNTLHLTKDFPFTGGGLGSFPGLYSKYILVIPYLFISYGSNLFLQIAVEHGVIGSLIYMSILIGGALILINRLLRKEAANQQQPLIFLSLGGYLALIVVGMMDAILYHGSGIFLLFAIPGFAAFSVDPLPGSNFSRHYPSLILGASLAVFLLSFGGNLRSAYYANLGAVEMARTDLMGWQGVGNIQPQPLGSYQSAVVYLNKALEEDEENRTANYRLGLLSVNQMDFVSGCSCLEKAYALDSGNRGIVKNLGYCYAWEGDIDLAANFLRNIPESSNELELYSWWWGTQNRNDLSGYASQVVKQLITIQQKGNH